MPLRNLTGTALVAVAAVLTFATANASAFTGISAGDPVTATLVSPTLTLGSSDSCTGSSLSGLVANDAGSGNGGDVSITVASFSGCTTLGSADTWATNALPWQLSVDGAGKVTLAGVDITRRWGLLACSYRGSLGGSYDQTTGDYLVNGSVTRYSGSSLCGSSLNFVGTYNIGDSAWNPVQL